MQDGLTALHCAARSGHVATISQLLKLHASVTSRTRRGLSALHLAVQGDHVQCVQLLTQACNVNDVTNVCAADACNNNSVVTQTYGTNTVCTIDHIGLGSSGVARIWSTAGTKLKENNITVTYKNIMKFIQ